MNMGNDKSKESGIFSATLQDDTEVLLIQFGGRILVGPTQDGDRAVLVLHESDETHEIGIHPDGSPKTVCDGDILLSFLDTRSIDVVISALTALKECLKNKNSKTHR